MGESGVRETGKERERIRDRVERGGGYGGIEW